MAAQAPMNEAARIATAIEAADCSEPVAIEQLFGSL
jgi:hypothetical protein